MSCWPLTSSTQATWLPSVVGARAGWRLVLVVGRVIPDDLPTAPVRAALRQAVVEQALGEDVRAGAAVLHPHQDEALDLRMGVVRRGRHQLVARRAMDLALG